MTNKNLLLLTALLPLIASTPVFSKNLTLTPAQPKSAIAQSSQTTLPKQLPVGGWLAFGTRANKNGRFKFGFSPVNSKAQLAIFADESSDWTRVKPGTSLVAIASGLKQTVKFRRLGNEPYGCDDIPTKMGTFTASKPFSEGPIWLLPPGNTTATALRLEAVNLTTIPTNILPANRRKPSEARAWKAGSSTIIMQKQSQFKVKLTVLANSKVIFTEEQEQYFMEGAEKTPVNLSEDVFAPGIAQPIGAFQLNANQPPVIVFWHPAYEGHGFHILASNKGRVQRIDTGSVYYCAF